MNRQKLEGMLHVTNSVHGVPIRLTYERWQHISQNHPEMAGLLYDILETVERPETVRLGPNGESIAERLLVDFAKRALLWPQTNE